MATATKGSLGVYMNVSKDFYLPLKTAKQISTNVVLFLILHTRAQVQPTPNKTFFNNKNQLE